MAMKVIDVEKAIALAKEKGLKPAQVKGTEMIQFTKVGGSQRLEVISWDEFKKVLKERGLAVYESGGWMKIRSK